MAGLLGALERGTGARPAAVRTTGDGGFVVEPVEWASYVKRGAGATGVRRDEAPTRTNTPLVTWDHVHNLVKINTWHQPPPPAHGRIAGLFQVEVARQVDRVEPARAQRLGEVAGLLGRVVDHDHAVDAGSHARVGKSRRAHALDRVGVAHQHQRRVGVATLVAATAAGSQHYDVVDVPTDRAWEIVSEELPLGLGQTRRG